LAATQVRPTGFIDRFFRADRRRGCYGFYSPAIDRIVFIDSRDLFLSLKAATFFSSKMILLIAAFDPPEQLVDNSNCYLWAPQKRIIQSAFHIPQLFPNVGNRKLVYRGPVAHIPEHDIRKVQEYLRFVVRVCYALYLTEALDNVNAAEMYEPFFPEFSPYVNLDRQAFLRVEQVLYRFETVDQGGREIDAILSERLDLNHRLVYYTRFNRLLYRRDTPPFKDG
jgi:hypothetical protein